MLGEKAGNMNWFEATRVEMGQLDEYYDTFKEYGHSVKTPDEYKKIRVHVIIDDKLDGETTKAYPPHPENSNGNGETSSYHVDAKLFHADLLTGQSITGLLLHFDNKTPIN